MGQVERENIKKLNETKYLIEINDLVISKKYGTGYVISVLYNEDVWNPINVNFNGNTQWLDSKGGGTNTDEGDAKYYRQIN